MGHMKIYYKSNSTFFLHMSSLELICIFFFLKFFCIVLILSTEYQKTEYILETFLERLPNEKNLAA